MSGHYRKKYYICKDIILKFKMLEHYCKKAEILEQWAIITLKNITPLKISSRIRRTLWEIDCLGKKKVHYDQRKFIGYKEQVKMKKIWGN